ncbi:hypothetical protein J1N35_024647 [Gossypium stocksii]|uniref:Aminotransferase-like plant mobile domain-containing protein n=1 Tax=Gossypium stocksii TaxID=47602 RepID=A0A9D3ZX24_9ROSI|nr:hypothetical protein J1N35_024647 [Gossypium stocksii]
MANFLIHFDDKHISTAQSIMVDDHVLEGFIHKLSRSPDTKIRSYLQDARLLHVFRMLESCKLDPILISASVEKWRPEIHMFHLPCNESTIAIEDVALQLGLSMYGIVVTGPAIVPDKEDF